MEFIYKLDQIAFLFDPKGPIFWTAVFNKVLFIYDANFNIIVTNHTPMCGLIERMMTL